MEVVDKKPVPIYEVICHECKSRIRYKACDVSWYHITCPVCGVSLKYIFPEYILLENRPYWCPILCQLPEGHGRLVDAGAKIYVMQVPVTVDDASWIVHALPTIVPAERSDNDFDRR